MIDKIINMFNRWNTKKQEINQKIKTIFIKERDIVYINMGKNIGFEQDGKGDEFLRPVIVYKKFNNNIFLGIPLTSTIKQNKYYFNFNFKSKTDGYRQSSAILSQVKLYDVKRVKFRLGIISKNDFENLYNKFIDISKPNSLEINTPKGESPEGICKTIISKNKKDVKYE